MWSLLFLINFNKVLYLFFIYNYNKISFLLKMEMVNLLTVIEKSNTPIFDCFREVKHTHFFMFNLYKRSMTSLYV